MDLRGLFYSGGERRRSSVLARKLIREPSVIAGEGGPGVLWAQLYSKM